MKGVFECLLTLNLENMPFNNFESRHFNEDEERAVTDAIFKLEEALVNKLANLTSSERQQLGSIKEQNKLVVNKVYEYSKNHPQLRSTDVDWDEFERDYRSRAFLEQVIQSLEQLLDGVLSAKILHDNDNYKASLVDYEFTKYKNSTSTPGFKKKEMELKQFFANRRNAGTSPRQDSSQEPTNPEETTD